MLFIIATVSLSLAVGLWSRRAALILTARVLAISGLELSSATVGVLDAPILLQEMVFAVWLITKGFDAAAFAPDSGR